MRHRGPVRRIFTALGASLFLVVASSGAVMARSELFTIAIDLDAGTERFASDSPLLCPAGDAFTDFHHGNGNFDQAGSFHLAKLIVCDDDSGSFVIGVNAGTNFVVGDGTTGGWRIQPGSGTGAYVGLSGGGSVVGINSHTPPVDLNDHYFGSVRP